MGFDAGQNRRLGWRWPIDLPVALPVFVVAAAAVFGLVWLLTVLGCASDARESRVFVKDGQLCSEIVVLPEEK